MAADPRIAMNWLWAIVLISAAVPTLGQQSLAQNARTVNDLHYVLGPSYRMFIAAYWRYTVGSCDYLSAKLTSDTAKGYLQSYCPFLTQCPLVYDTQSCIVQQSAFAVRKACCKESTCNYGKVWPSEKIFGGQPADREEFPWVAMLLVDGKFTCGCVILDQSHALTAAHCLRGLNGTEKLEVLAGRYHYNLSIEEGGNQRVMVKYHLKHEQYNFVTITNDIAMLVLETPLMFNTYVTPACLPPRGDKPEPSCTVAGWGAVNKTQMPEVLMKVDLLTYSIPSCLNTFKDTSKPPGDLAKYLTDGTFCAANGLLGGRDACWGDSGGPLMCIKTSADNVPRYHLFGIVSNGADCAKAGEPGIYSSVAYYLDWIDSKLTSS